MKHIKFFSVLFILTSILFTSCAKNNKLENDAEASSKLTGTWKTVQEVTTDVSIRSEDSQDLIDEADIDGYVTYHNSSTIIFNPDQTYSMASENLFVNFKAVNPNTTITEDYLKQTINQAFTISGKFTATKEQIQLVAEKIRLSETVELNFDEYEKQTGITGQKNMIIFYEVSESTFTILSDKAEGSRTFTRQ